MNQLVLLLFVLLQLLSVVVSENNIVPSTIEGVIELDSRNFDSKLRDGNVWLIEFYASWCGHCRNFEMEYQGVALLLHERNYRKELTKKVFVAKVDGDVEKAIASRFDIAGYPTFCLVDGWNVYEYGGERSRQALVDYAQGGYKEYEPIPFLTSPKGPMGQFRALLMYAGTYCMDMFDWINEQIAMSPVVTGFILLAGFTVSSLFGMIVIAILLTPTDTKTD